MIPVIAAASYLLTLAASGDYVLSLPGERPICAKSRETCEEARAAIAARRWPIVPRETPTRCTPMPGCFQERSNCIARFNCP